MKLAALEEAEEAEAFASGMGAISALLLHVLKAGDHAVVSDVAYAALSEMTNELIPGLGDDLKCARSGILFPAVGKNSYFYDL